MYDLMNECMDGWMTVIYNEFRKKKKRHFQPNVSTVLFRDGTSKNVLAVPWRAYMMREWATASPQGADRTPETRQASSSQHAYHPIFLPPGNTAIV